MKIGLLHLSDIHISEKDNNLNELIPKIQLACHFELNEIIKLYIVITGDIANTGKEEEYRIALSFFKELESYIKNKNTYINSIKFILVAGNHDCLFKDDDPVRDALLSSVKNDDVKVQITDACLEVQDYFWAFYKELVGNVPPSKISYQIEDKLSLDISLFFNCYNTSWMSIKKEVDNNKVIPSDCLINTNKRDNDLTISLFHHPTSWFSPHTPLNNKKCFEDHLLKTSNIVLCGHEHSASNKKVVALKGNNEFVYLEAPALNERKGESAFKFICFDTDDFSGNSYSFELEDKEYKEKELNVFKLNHIRNDINIDDDFYRKITDIIIPLKHPNVEKLSLPDVFIFPDLEPYSESDNFTSRKLKDSYDILEFENEKIIIEGENQSGRTSLLYAYYYKLFKNDYYPLYVRGKDIKKGKVKDLIKQCIREQYRKPFSVHNYIEKDISKRVILIDDIDSCDLNSDGKSKFIKDLEKEFSKIIITTKEAGEIHTFTENNKLYSDFKHYIIKPLGYYKRNKLIELWIKLGLDNATLKVDETATAVKSTFDTISGLLGEQLIPSYPIFILSLLQSLDNQLKPFNVVETSYAYCYHSLILLSLVRVGVQNNEIGGLFNFLTEFAYYLHDSKLTGVDQNQLKKFHVDYINKYPFDHSIESVVDIFLKSNILKEEDDVLTFSYKYLSYYLSAKKIASFMHEDKGYNEIVNLCDNLHIEKNANILIFITHHSTNNKLIEELLLASMIPFDSRTPITLDKDDRFFEFLTSFITNVKEDIVLRNNNPDEYRAKRLREMDEQKESGVKDKNKYQITEQDFSDPNVVDITQTLKIIKILGQIVKNQHGTFEKDKLTQLIQSAYLANFRLMDFFSKMLMDAKDEIIDILSEKTNDSADKNIVQKKVSDFLYYLGYRMCLASFSSLGQSVGTSSLKSLYDNVADNIGSPAAKLVTFSIKTYYDKINITELQELINEYKDNPVATHIIKARVANHVYNNHVAYDKKQKISSICNMKLLN